MIYCYHRLLLGGVTLKYQKVMKYGAIVLSIAFLVLEVYLWIRMQNTWDDLILSQSSYESAGLMFAGLFQYGSFFLGIFLIPIVWLEYWLITIFCHVYQKYLGFKKIFSRYVNCYSYFGFACIIHSNFMFDLVCSLIFKTLFLSTFV